MLDLVPVDPLLPFLAPIGPFSQLLALLGPLCPLLAPCAPFRIFCLTDYIFMYISDK